MSLPTHAVHRLRAARLARSTKPFLARGGMRAVRCTDCRLPLAHCMCALRPQVPTHCGMCLIMADIEPLKPTNTGWLIADVVADTFAFGWMRTGVDPALLALLADPQWQPYVVFPGEFVDSTRVLHTLLQTHGDVHGDLQGDVRDGACKAAPPSPLAAGTAPKRPLFILLDATWPEARKMFRKSPYLNAFPVLSLQSEQLSRYRLRRSTREDHFCTCEVAALCLQLASETWAAHTLEAYLDVFTTRYLRARQQLPLDADDAPHRQLRALAFTAAK